MAAVGSHLGPYELLSSLGSGGMGEVFKARDTRLDRTVAIKILSSHLAADADAKARFEREARSIAALNHPHICTLYDIGHENGIDFLVMELVQGETLAKRLESGALPLERALETAIDIADALDAAHRHGIVHRDLKPGNIMLTKAGVKLLDFGLAKLCAVGTRAVAGLSAVPTHSDPVTDSGRILGTVPYMAPEQLYQTGASDRGDLWALPLFGERKPIEVARTESTETGGQFSPDGRWFAYASDGEVYVQAFPPSGGKWQISTIGGREPRWCKDGKELFYLSPGELMAVPVKTDPTFEAGAAKVLFSTVLSVRFAVHYAATNDGQRFLLPYHTRGASRPPTVIVNWTSLLDR